MKECLLMSLEHKLFSMKCVREEEEEQQHLTTSNKKKTLRILNISGKHTSRMK